MPVDHALGAEDIVPSGLNVAELEEHPLQVSRFRFEDLFEDIKVFRRMHSVDSEIESVGRHPVFAGGGVEDFRRNGVIEAARADDDGIELVLMLGIELQLCGDAFRDHWGQKPVNDGAGGGEEAERDRAIPEIAEEAPC